MKLNESKIKSLKPKLKSYKMGDGNGLYLFIKPTGRKYWRMKYFYGGKEKVLSIGPYPEISLADAREKRFEVKKLLANCIDPGELKREQQRQKETENANSFEHIALEWHSKKSAIWTPYYANQVKQRFKKDIFPRIGHRPIATLTAKDILDIALVIEERDAFEIAHRAVQVCNQIFQYAIITERAENNPAAALRGVLKTKPRKHHAFIERKELAEFLEALEIYDGSLQTKLAIKLILLTFVRTTELRAARWAEFDFEHKYWRIPLERMKNRIPHIVPLSTQAIEVLY